VPDTSFSLVWPAVRTFAVLDAAGQVVRCQPYAGPVKVIYLSEDDAASCARMLRELGQGESRVYECSRPRGAHRRRHYHLTSQVGDRQDGG